MARTSGSPDLFDLIHSLNTSEKGYFQKYARRHKDKNNDYLKLFNAIDKMESYNEQKLKPEFKNLPVLKNYLFELILESLFISETSPPPLQTVLKGLVKINLLLKKNLKNKALKLFAEYKLMAEENGLFSLLGLLIKLEQNVLRMSWQPTEKLQKIKLSDKLKKQAEDKQRNVDDMLIQQHLAVTLIQLRDHSNLKYVPDDWLDPALLQSKKNSFSPYAEKLRLAALAKYHVLKGELYNFHKTNAEIYKLEKQRWLKMKGEINPEDYLVSIGNYIASAIEIGEAHLALNLAESLLSVKLSNKTLFLENMLRYTHLKQVILWALGKHAAGELISNEMIDKYQLVDDLRNYWARKIRIVEAKALFEFSNGNYKESLTTMRFLTPGYLAEYSEEGKKTAELFNLLIQYEIGNYALIKSLTKSIRARWKSLNEEEKHFLSIFNKHAHSPAQLFSGLGANCPNLLLLHFLYVSDWVESKINRQPLSGVVYKNYLAQSNKT